MSIPQHYYEGQARELDVWIESRKRERRVQIQLDAEKELEEIRMLEKTMTIIGLTVLAVILLVIFALVAFWISPWAIVSMLSLAAFMWSWAKYKGRW